ncbi:UDP-3-O-(3-hydroxymyristoyl)glucosamine N-acyltransferase [Parvularcula dongshanensis]|uniref:UDP-3-O-acylglucosamine N-acyltransferase n=1 Tax=Parvularcula dongshanensis TaxID=1173995 RepID=A0A840I4Y8_9PROT|nr:UDP-3-O-(3-hydroxymyristoyl)glucosamine N-acyltransferase [Parvularcula dongshanensis]MBB4659395.1 UDP-3-O-[3-hydroxymyristoyl] glucosamine N-acyltransferase [Parvularcula dongshanensis]
MSAPDSRFFTTAPPLSVAAACAAADATLRRGGEGAVDHVSSLTGAAVGSVVFVETARAASPASGTPTLCLVTDAAADAAADAFPTAAIAITKTPKLGFARLATALHASHLEIGPPPAGIAPDARIAPSAEIAPSAVIGPGAEIGEDVVIGPFAFIGPGVVVGAGSRIGSHATITHAVIGERCAILAGVRIGEPGFGYVPGPTGAVTMPQLGRVLIGDAVDVGANSCIDRGALGDTVVGNGTKIDNLCQVAHNCRLGQGVLIASQTGLSGSVTIGDGAMLGGKAGLADHIEIGAGAVVMAGAGVMNDVPAGERWGGVPARPAKRWLREVATLSRLAKGPKT